MFLPRYSTRTALVILAVAGVMFAIVSQGILGIQQRWEPLREDPLGAARSVMIPMAEVSIWRQVCAGLTVAMGCLAALMTINGLFFLVGWAIGRRLDADPRKRLPKPPPQFSTDHPPVASASAPLTAAQTEPVESYSRESLPGNSPPGESSASGTGESASKSDPPRQLSDGNSSHAAANGSSRVQHEKPGAST